MKDYKDRMTECLEHLRSIRFPCRDWKEDTLYFDALEQEFSQVPEEEDAKAIFAELKQLIAEKRTSSLNCNKTTEELFAGWNDD